MAVGDLVMISSGSQGGTTYAPRGPRFGRITAEVAGPPVLATVLWEDGELTTGIDRDATLLFLTAALANDPALFDLIGKFCQVQLYPSTAGSDVPKSPAAAGLVHRAFVSSTYDPVALFGNVVMSWQNGKVVVVIPMASAIADPDANELFQFNLMVDTRREVGFD